MIESLIAPNKIAYGKFGRSLDIVNDHILIGATYAEEAYLFELNNDNDWDYISSFSSDQRSKSLLSLIHI